jgi:hypothetical protein
MPTLLAVLLASFKRKRRFFFEEGKAGGIVG